MIDLCTGNYDLAQTASDPDKEYYFVKLTDSALRAIELYQNSRGRHSAPTIQFLGNNGVISFASAGQRFNFSIDEMDGSFQCIKQSRNHLNVEGAMPHRMRIHANEDVFETTKLRMAVAEETVKSKSAREIKPNQKDIGRKVKLESTSVSATNAKSQSQFRLPQISTSASSSSVSRTNASPGYQQQYSPRPAISPLHSSNNIFSSDSNDNMPQLLAADHDMKPVAGTKTNSGSRGMATNPTNNNPKSRNATEKDKNQKNTSPKGPDITKKKLRDRLIHLLAYKPFKKPELYARLQREGIRDKEKSAIGVILKEISTLKENSFNLKPHIWSSVQEDWPFYDEQELQVLKNRKSQNLKPSPNSTNSGPKLRNSFQNTQAGSSPSSNVPSTNRDNVPITNRENSSIVNHTGEGPATKKQRISHFKREGNEVLDLNSGHPAAKDDNSNVASHLERNRTTDTTKGHRSNGNPKNNPAKCANNTNTKQGKGRKLDDNIPRKSSPPSKSPRDSHTSDIKRADVVAQKSDDHAHHKSVLASKSPRDNTTSENRRAATRQSTSSSRASELTQSNKSSDVMIQKQNDPAHQRPAVPSRSPRDNTTTDSRRADTRQSTSSSRASNSSELTQSNKSSDVMVQKQNDYAHHRPVVPSKSPRDNTTSDNRRADTRQSTSSSRTSSSIELTQNNKHSDGMVQKQNDHAHHRPMVPSKSPRDNNPSESRRTDTRQSTSSSRTSSSSGLTENLSTSSRMTDTSISNHSHSRNVPNTYNENVRPEPVPNPAPAPTSYSASKPQYDFIEMPKINSIEQRRAYKAEFERNYTEYRQLEEETDRVSKRFKKLALRLETNKQDPAAYEEIRRKIVKEYERTNNDPQHKERKARHVYLHAKLAHIKALVDEFDQILRSSIDDSGAAAPQSLLQENVTTDGGGFHYYADTQKAENIM